MNSADALHPEPHRVLACTVSTDILRFEPLITQMEASVGELWGDLTVPAALSFVASPEASSIQFLCLALTEADTVALPDILDLIDAAQGRRVKLVLISDGLPAADCQAIERAAGVPILSAPLTEAAVAAQIDQVLAPPAPQPGTSAPQPTSPVARSGVILPVHGLVGGAGASTFAVNLAWELAHLPGQTQMPRVCLLDFDLQFGSVATYLDLPPREAVLEVLSDVSRLDAEAFLQAMQHVDDRLHVLPAPPELVPLDLLSPDDVRRLLRHAQGAFDYTVIDMPLTYVDWTQTVLECAHVCFALIDLDIRSAQNTLRIKRALQAEDLPFDKFRFVLNRAPGFTDFGGKARVSRFAESVGISIDVQLPDGGRGIAQAGDQGLPLATALPKSALRRAIADLAAGVHEVGEGDAHAV